MDEGETRARDWLRTWQDVPVPDGAVGPAAGGAHHQTRSLDRAARQLRLDDEPWRLRTVLAARARR